ncbi:MAG TPA: bacteriohemerythrin [Defluviitaleaceae bacterium]|nr:hemerythrin family protein [Candidatus Epulonipiscium sp.]HOQ16525.1 bacteriohemerythrin [Defluviitaleaceae bacterium]HPT75645.1 bacteriohemerythrin [Defluviitaleaceae bacterium]HQD50168.1 bacteriohemerythrin [Defluviitaleaceae bacterium]
MVKWSDDYLIGVPEIDEQHKRLFEIAGRAYKVMQDEYSIDKYDQIIEIIEELKDYAVYHFKSEEEYLTKIQYKKFFSQKIAHDSFVEKINNIDYEKIDEEQDKYLIEIMDFIVNWIVNHIIKLDKEIPNVPL